MDKKEKQWQEKVTHKLFEYCYGELDKYDNPKEYIDNVMSSPLWDDERVYKQGRVTWLQSVWDAHHRTLGEVVELSGLSKAAFYRYFGVPRRTFQDWLYGVNSTPDYTLFMMQEILGLVTRF